MGTPKALDLFQAYAESKLPVDGGGYIVSSFFSNNTSYSIYEVIAYDSVKSIHPTSDSLTFQSDGYKIYVLVEPANYPHKHQEPFTRVNNETIPHRFSELDIVIAKNQTKLMISKEPVISYSSFTILKPTGIDFAFFFFNNKDVLKTIEFFFTQTLNQEACVPSFDTKKCAKSIVVGLGKFKIWS